MYLEFRAIPTADARKARVKPWGDFALTVDVANKKGYIHTYRLVCSSEFVVEGELKLGRIGHVKVPP